MPKFDDSPLLSLLTKEPHTMSVDELKAYVSDLRTNRTSAQTRRASINKREPKPKHTLDLKSLIS